MTQTCEINFQGDTSPVSTLFVPVASGSGGYPAGGLWAYDWYAIANAFSQIEGLGVTLRLII